MGDRVGACLVSVFRAEGAEVSTIGRRGADVAWGDSTAVGRLLDGRWFSTASRRAAGTFPVFRARSGGQRFSWIHIADVLAIVRFLRTHEELDGSINAAAPGVSDSRTLMAMLRRIVRMPVGLPSPRWMLEIGSAVIRTETELVLKSRWVVPERLLTADYHFEFPELEPALRNVIEGRKG